MRVRCPECDITLRVPAEDADRKIECPECGERFRPLRDDDDDRPRRRTSPARREKAGGSKLPAVVGTAVAAVVAAGAVAWVVLDRPKPQAPVPAVKPPEVAQNNPAPGQLPGQAGLPAAVETPEVIALNALFRLPADAPPPTRRLVKLETAGDGGPVLEVPAFAARPIDPDAGKLTPDEAKAATAYIKVGDGDRLSTGSGFLVATSDGGGLVATNRHVIEDALAKPAAAAEGAAATPPPGITVVFNSNVPGKEVSLKATVAAVHPTADLAVLRIPGGKLPAKPIDPWAAPPVTEGTEVRILGFPLGENLGRGGASPNISVSPGSVSSLRTDKDGKLEQVQITGPLIFGNSGGPIVDKDGRLVGVAVSTLLGTGLGFAVPAAELTELLGGKFLPAAVVPYSLEGGTARFKVAVPLVDPLGRVKGVHLRYQVGGPKPDPAPDEATGHKLLDAAGRVDLALSDGPAQRRTAAGELSLPADAAGVILQVVAEGPAGAVVASPPVAFTPTAGEVASGRDAGKLAGYLAEVKADPDGLAGKVRTVRARVVFRPTSLASFQDIGVAGPDGSRPPPGVRFMTDRATATQFDELTTEQEGLDARVVLVAGPRWQNGQVPVRVARVDFLDEWDRPVKSIPGGAADGQLAALNRDPEAFAARSVVVDASAVFAFDRQGIDPDYLPVVFPGLHVPRNLRFVTPPALTQRLAQERFRPFAPYRVRLAVVVGARPDKNVPATVSVRKVEVLDAKGERVLKTIE